MSTSEKILLGFAAGVVAGAIGVLLLPSETREELAKDTDNAYRNARTNVKWLKQQIKQTIKEYAERTRTDEQ